MLVQSLSYDSSESQVFNYILKTTRSLFSVLVIFQEFLFEVLPKLTLQKYIIILHLPNVFS